MGRLGSTSFVSSVPSLRMFGREGPLILLVSPVIGFHTFGFDPLESISKYLRFQFIIVLIINSTTDSL